MHVPCSIVAKTMYLTDELTGVECAIARRTVLYLDGSYRLTNNGVEVLAGNDPAVYAALLRLNTITPGEPSSGPDAPRRDAWPIAQTAVGASLPGQA